MEERKELTAAQVVKERQTDWLWVRYKPTLEEFERAEQLVKEGNGHVLISVRKMTSSERQFQEFHVRKHRWSQSF